MGRVTRDIGKADDDQLVGIDLAVSDLLDRFGCFIGGDLQTYLCVLREAAQTQAKRRRAEMAGAGAGAVRSLSVVQASPVDQSA